MSASFSQESVFKCCIQLPYTSKQGLCISQAFGHAGAQVIMAVRTFYLCYRAMYVGTLLVGLGYGAHWAVVPAGASELFGLKSFGALYNVLTLANPMGSLVFSGVIANSLYYREAERQAHQHSLMSSFDDEPQKCNSAICFFLSSLIMSGSCICALVLSMILVYRTKMVDTTDLWKISTADFG